jgi:SAM-dependent methyltransferase
VTPVAHQAFDDLSDAYEAMIDWPKRLAHEAPFYRGLFERLGAKSVLDAACGTGHHAAMFHDWGLRVEGADLSPRMIERCRAQCGESERLHWTVRGFDQPGACGDTGLFDVAICVGNSLALAPDLEVAGKAVRELLAAVRPGGAVVVHVLNLWRLSDGPCVWQKCRRATLPQPHGDSLIVKGVHRCGGRGYVDMLVTRLGAQSPALCSECVPFLGFEAHMLETMAHRGGARAVEFFGGYQQEHYLRLESQDLIMLAQR